MGEIADAIVEGEFDYLTGEYIGPPVGYPRTLAERTSTSHSDIKTKNVNGVNKYLRVYLRIQKQQDRDKIIREYCKIKMPPNVNQSKLKQMCVFIQSDFNSFVLYLKEKLQQPEQMNE